MKGVMLLTSLNIFPQKKIIFSVTCYNDLCGCVGLVTSNLSIYRGKVSEHVKE